MRRKISDTANRIRRAFVRGEETHRAYMHGLHTGRTHTQHPETPFTKQRVRLMKLKFSCSLRLEVLEFFGSLPPLI